MSAPTVSPPPIVCRPWCKGSDGHAGEAHSDDQHCRGESEFVARDLAPKWSSGDAWHAHELEVFASSGPSRYPAVVIYDCGDDLEIRLDAGEARALSRVLAEVADELEGKAPTSR